jgi:hypothetical protein
MNPSIYDVISRFHPMGSNASNDALVCSPIGYEQVPEEVRSVVDYPRPPFNWPEPASPMGNTFSLGSMAVDVLHSAGFTREARGLEFRLKNDHPAYADMPALFHRFLDFSPPPELPSSKQAQLSALADDLGLDPASLSRGKKKALKNQLAHSTKKHGPEWTWLVEHADQTSVFGKTAACELADATKVALAAQWLAQHGTPAGDASDASFANKTWFDKHFPRGWSHLDHLSETACVSSNLDFSARVTLMTYELTDKTSRGWDLDSAAHIAYRHKNSYGITGSALIGQQACDFFTHRLMPRVNMIELPGSGALSAHLARCNPSMAPLSDDASAWICYRALDPEPADLIEKAWLESALKQRPTQKASLTSQIERLALFSEFVHLFELAHPTAESKAQIHATQKPIRL